MHPFDYCRPETTGEATAILREHGRDARVLAGGTDLMVGLREGKLSPRVVVDIKRVRDLSNSIEIEPEWAKIGANANMTEVARDSRLRSLFPALCEAAEVVGSIQIRNRATLTGNVCNASPAADTVPALAAYGAFVHVIGSGSDRLMTVEEFILGNRRIALQTGELAAAIWLPMANRPVGSGFARITRRRGVDLATVNVCCSISSEGIATFSFGAVSPRPLVVRDAGELTSPSIDASTKSKVIDDLASKAQPISDVRASADYRRAMVRVLALRAHARAVVRMNE